MDTLDSYRQIIRRIITEYARIPYAHGEITRQAVLDAESDNYLLMIFGRERGRRVHGCIIHVNIINGKIWIQRDGTEYGIANELTDAGVPKDQIVLGFRSPELRRHTEFAVA
jgi:hypothetical protein